MQGIFWLFYPLLSHCTSKRYHEVNEHWHIIIQITWCYLFFFLFSDLITRINSDIASNETGRLYAVVYLQGRQFKVTTNDLIIMYYHLEAELGETIRLNKVHFQFQYVFMKMCMITQLGSYYCSAYWMLLHTCVTHSPWSLCFAYSINIHST